MVSFYKFTKTFQASWTNKKTNQIYWVLELVELFWAILSYFELFELFWANIVIYKKSVCCCMPVATKFNAFSGISIFRCLYLFHLMPSFLYSLFNSAMSVSSAPSCSIGIFIETFCALSFRVHYKISSSLFFGCWSPKLPYCQFLFPFASIRAGILWRLMTQRIGYVAVYNIIFVISPVSLKIGCHL